MVDLQRVVAVVQSVRNAPDMDLASVPIIALLEEKQEALAEAGRLSVEKRDLKASYDDQMKTALVVEEQRDNFRMALESIAITPSMDVERIKKFAEDRLRVLSERK